MGTLIICEKNDAARQISRVLSGGKAKRRVGAGVPVYEMDWDGPTAVMGLRGHILELDFDKAHRRWSIQGDKLHALVDADVQKAVTEEKIVKELRRRAKSADTIIIATDYDREGELIGVEALEALGDVSNKTVKRAKYSSFTKKEVEKAFSELQEVDYKLAQAGEARQIIDLAWGAALTRFVSIAGGRRGRDFLSVGRVQTPTLGLIVDKEKEILAFVPVPYWEVEADVEAEPAFTATHPEQPFQEEARAAAAHEAIQRAGMATIASVEEKTVNRKAPAPFHTTAYIQACSNLGMGAKRAMDVAQKLYLAGFISYHRTENTVYPSTLDLDEHLAMLTKGPLAKDASWVQQNRRPEPTRGKKETTDHPPIYPTGVPGAGDKLSDMELRVWELVARRFLATLSPDAKLAQVTVDMEAGGEPLRATGQTTLEPGWRKVYPYSKGKEVILPPMQAGDILSLAEVRLLGKETQPPKRFGQGSLVAEMERLGIGTKATRHETIQKLVDRHYVTEDPVQPTLVGFAVTEALLEHAKRITDPSMTAQLEEEMSQIESGKRTLEETLDDSKTILHEVVDTLLRNQEPIKERVRKALEEDAHVGTCPVCGEKLLRRTNRFGGRFIGCKGYPDCTQTYNLPPRGLLEFREEPCGTCGAPFVTVNERGRKTEQCVNAECETRKAAAEAEKMELGPCPTCSEGTLEMLRSRNWKRFVKCNNDACDQTYPLPQRGQIVHERQRCEHCGSPRVKVITKGRKPWEICINMECPGREEEKAAKAKAKSKS